MANELNKSDKAKGILAKIAAMFSAQEATIEHKLADGTTVVKMDKLERGGKIAGITVAGEYTLSDGTKVVYDVAGVITEVTPSTPIALTDYKLKDGTTISCDKFEVGGMAKIGGQPAPAGVYELADGGSVTVGADGVITAAAKAAAAAAPDLTTPAGMLAAYNQFAGGTIDAAGISTILKALMEYSFGWQLREAQEKASRDAALKVYQEGLATSLAPLPAVVAQNKAQGAMLKQMFELMSEVLELPTGEAPATGKKKFSFADNDSRKKTFGKFQEAAKKLSEQWKEMDKVA